MHCAAIGRCSWRDSRFRSSRSSPLSSSCNGNLSAALPRGPSNEDSALSELVMRGIRKSFSGIDVLKDIDLAVRDREFVVLVGPSGCGKSTLLRIMAGLEDMSEGDLLIDGLRMNDVPAAQRGLAMVFQSYALYPHMTVAENMSVGLRIAGTPKDVIAAKVGEAARILQ